MSWLYNILIVFLVTATAIVGDIFLKNATSTDGGKQALNFAIGVGIYALVAFGFYYMYKLMEFSVTGVMYAVVTILLSVGIGAILFHEQINVYEWIGIALALVSVFLLSRFA